MILSNGDVICEGCRTILGNINGDYNYFRMIRLKYCPECKLDADRQRKAEWARERRRVERQKKKLESEKLKLLEQENELLRKRIMELKEK